MSTKKRSETNGEDLDIKYKVFERLSQKGVLQSVQQQMRKAIADEVKLIRNGKSELNGDHSHETTKNGIKEEVNGFESIARVSSIANWEKQIRYELDIEREIQTREAERQKEKLESEWRKLRDRDKTLRIELDSREKKLRQKEEMLRTHLDDVDDKLNEIAVREQTVNEIVGQKIKTEMSDEIERLRKKFNELEQSRASLSRREEKLKSVESRLQEQANIVKEKIDGKRDCEIELARLRKEYEIVKKENEVLRQRVNSMNDYQVVKFENSLLRNELIAVKDALKNKVIEFGVERDHR